jgi:hypothetical protein
MLVTAATHLSTSQPVLSLCMVIPFPQPGSSITSDDFGAPMIFLVLPVMTVAFIPIVLIEAKILSEYLSLSFRRSILPAFVSNAVSTFLGLPVAWIILFLMEMVLGGGRAPTFFDRNSIWGQILSVTLEAPWLMISTTNWKMPTAALILGIPFFFASWAIEHKVCARWLRQEDRDEVRRAVRDGNLITYEFLGIFDIVWLLTFIR